MPFNPREYEYVYGFQLLDDIHNLFPEFLYDSGYTHSMIVSLLQNRVRELFPQDYVRNRGHYLVYQQEQTYRAAGIPPPPRTPPQRIRTYTVPATPQRVRRPPRPVASPPASPSFGNSATTTFTIPLTTQDPLTSLFSSLLLNGNRQDLADLLTPVPVTPTPQQLASASILSSLEPSRDVTCTICQDHEPPTGSHEWRILRRCTHRFHRSCIDQWFRQNVHCPVCRHDIRDLDSSSSEDEYA